MITKLKCFRANSTLVGSEQLYDHGAVVPAFNEGKSIELSKLVDQTTFRQGYDVLIGQSPLANEHLLLEHLEQRAGLRDQIEVFSSKLSKSCVELAEAWVTKVFSSRVGWKRLGLLLGIPNAWTTTFDFDAGCYVGIHVDDWNGKPMNQRSSGDLRLIINMSMEHRFFLVADYQVSEKIPAFTPEKQSLTQSFRETSPTGLKVKCIRLSPGDWIALNAENLPHDGSTYGCLYSGFAYTCHFDASLLDCLIYSKYSQ